MTVQWVKALGQLYGQLVFSGHWRSSWRTIWRTKLDYRIKQVPKEKPVWKNQYCMLHYHPLIIYMEILWNIWTTVHIDMEDTSNILFGCIIILGKVSAESFYHAQNGKYQISTRHIMISMHLLSRVKKMKSAVWILMTKIFFIE